jgi:hypothetical protein
MATTFSIPGSFNNSDKTNVEFPTPKATFYLPPSPSASSALSQTVRSHSRASISSKDTRRRPRIDGRPNSTTPRPSRTLSSVDPGSLDAPSPAPLVNTQYVIAGGGARDAYDEDAYDYEQDLRPNRYSQQSSQNNDSYFPQTPASICSGKRRRLSASRRGWGKTVWQYTGGLAGKAINICWTAAFNGFHAGSGKGYDMDVGTPLVIPGDPAQVSSRKDVFDDEYRGSCNTPVPGGYPEDNDTADIRTQTYELIPTPTASNDHGGASTLRSNWVVIDAPAMRDAETSPVRKRPRPSTANLYARPAPRPNGIRPRMHARNSASFASPRASSSGDTDVPTRPDSSGSDGGHQHKRARSSLASPRRRDSSHSGPTTPKSPDVVKFEKKLQKQNLRQDNSMKRLNQQLQDMIREGQQALGSKVEVYEDVGDEGFEDGVRVSSYGPRWE